MKNYINKQLSVIGNVLGLSAIKQQMLELKILTARACINQMKLMPAVKDLSDAEYKVFSQFGDDGIIQYLIHRLDISKNTHTFIEFGVENYEESNTRFLLMNNNWRGLIMDGSKANMDYVHRARYYWKHDITAMAAFIDTENINQLILDAGFNGEIGILSVDIDGNDYWVWEKISVVQPVIVVAEYNGIFGSELPLSVPYNPTFVRTQAHFSNLYWGCSLAALNHLATRKGYTFAGCNSAGNNAYFIRNDYLNDAIPTPSLQDGFSEPKFKESRGKAGELTYLKGENCLKQIAHLPMVNVVTSEQSKIGQLFQVGS